MINKLHRFTAAPILLFGLGAPALFASGCGDDPLGCDATLAAKVEAFRGAVDALVQVSGEMKATVAVACSNIATELGATDVPDVGDGTNVEDDTITEVCNLASTTLSAAIDASGGITVSISGGKCEVAADAQISCEANCSVDGSCTPGGVEARCEPGELSGSCSAECTGSCTVETGSVECAGTCEGTCTGECSTGPSGGICEGECSGGCEGTCEVVAPEATCEGSCKGGCSVEYEAPSCEVELTEPDCQLEAECEGGCEAQGNLKAECTPPSIVVEGDADIAAVLEANLPDLVLAAQVQGELFLESAAFVAETGVAVAGAAIGQAGCVAQFGADLAAEFGASVEASASVSVSVEASASVSGSASGG